MRTDITTPLVAALLLAAPLAHAQFDAVEIEKSHVAGSVWMLTGSGGNIGVSAGADGILLIDDQFAPLAPKIRAALASIAKGDVDYLVNTHWHGDHTSGNTEFAAEATIISHHNVRRRLARDPDIGGRVAEEKPKPGALPVLTFSEDLALHFNGESIQAIHFPHSHTDGDTVLFFPGSKVVHMGDLMFSGLFPFVDIDSGGDVEGLLKSVDAILEKLPTDTKLIPGHGPLSTVDDLETYRRMIAESIGLVQKHLANGRSADDVVEAGVGEEWKSWSWSFISEEKWLRTVHRSLTR